MDSVILLLVIIISLVSYHAFKNPLFYERYVFHVDQILIGKEHHRMFSSGFLHGDYIHLGFNMIALYTFGVNVGEGFGLGYFLFIYLASLLAGSLFALYIHRNHGDYRAVGASGAISGVIYARIAMNPEGLIGFIFVPPFIPGWLFGVLFVLISIYGIQSQKDNIGHEAHLGGAIAGMLLAIVLKPSVLQENSFYIFLVLVPTVVFLYLLVQRPEMMHIDNFFQKEWKNLRSKSHSSYSNDSNNTSTSNRRSRRSPQSEAEELDALLDKVNRKGLDQLTEAEKARLEELSRKL